MMIKRLTAIAAAVALSLSLCACGGADNDTEKKEPTTTTETATTTTTEAPKTAVFEVSVVDQNGAPVADVMLQVCKDTCIPAKTDANGIAKFNIEVTDEHKLSVLSCPTGYTYTGEQDVYLEDGITVYTVEVQGE